MKFRNSKFNYLKSPRQTDCSIRMKTQYDNVKHRCSEHEKRIQQLLTLLNEKQIHIDDLNSEKR